MSERRSARQRGEALGKEVLTLPPSRRPAFKRAAGHKTPALTRANARLSPQAAAVIAKAVSPKAKTPSPKKLLEAFEEVASAASALSSPKSRSPSPKKKKRAARVTNSPRGFSFAPLTESAHKKKASRKHKPHANNLGGGVSLKRLFRSPKAPRAPRAEGPRAKARAALEEQISHYQSGGVLGGHIASPVKHFHRVDRKRAKELYAPARATIHHLAKRLGTDVRISAEAVVLLQKIYANIVAGVASMAYRHPTAVKQHRISVQDVEGVLEHYVPVV